MRKTVSALAALAALLALAGCGVDGEPLKPTYSVKTTVGYNSATGPFNSTVFGIQIGS